MAVLTEMAKYGTDWFLPESKINFIRDVNLKKQSKESF